MTFDEFYILWYSRMKRFAREYVISEDDAEDIVQDICLELYERYDLFADRANRTAYLFTAIKNRCIDHLRRKMIEQDSFSRIQEEHRLTLRMKFDSLEVLDDNLFNENDIEDVIRKALATLPERCRQIVVLHKIEGKKQKVIAEELNISLKTVENQLTIAYKKLREELQK
ncbi:MAG: RNA polymerase sigma-70 factor [Tannerella sp.]|jgi:RNA polymerase sigma-70 factor (ECF subfamily)|nr:RNA polymerase sigma-70 factor [Tannerella sp.]